MPKISEFQREWRFLSNFWPANVMYEGLLYPSAEHAYQAAKFEPQLRHFIQSADSAAKAKRLGRTFYPGNRTEDWDSIKNDEMFKIVHDKFTRTPALRKALIATGDAILEEGNLWHDRYWGICPPNSGQGRNELGKILMAIREELRT